MKNATISELKKELRKSYRDLVFNFIALVALCFAGYYAFGVGDYSHASFLLLLALLVRVE